MKHVSMSMMIWGILTPADQYKALILLCMMVVGMLLEMLGIGLVIPVFALLTQDDFVEKYPLLHPMLQAIGSPDRHELIIGAMLVLVVAYFIKTLFLAWFSWRQASFAFGMQAQLSYRLFSVYLEQPYTFHLQHNSAQLIRNILNEVGIFIFNGILPSMMLISEGLVFFGLCVLLLIAQPVGALIVVSALGLAAWVFHLVTKSRISVWGELRQYHEGLRMQHLQQGLGGAKEILIFGRYREFLSLFQIHNQQLARVGRLQNVMQQLPRLWFEMLAISGLAILVVTMLIQGSEVDDVLPMLGLFAVAAFRLMPSVNRLLGAVQSVRYGIPVIDVLYRELHLATQSDEVQKYDSKVIFQNRLELDLISYVYPDTADSAIDNISLVIKRGESIGLVGSSGAGKSTLVDIILGLLSPCAGEVRVDGRNIKGNVRCWQDQIGYVPQSIFLTDDTLRRNIGFGLSDAQIDDHAVLRSLALAQLEAFVDQLPDGLDTVVGEHGVRLSGGQRQRIGIARALYHNPEVLVLDEATSALDVNTEREVMKGVNMLQGEKTLVIVAHRLSTVEKCDRIYRLESGRLVLDGGV